MARKLKYREPTDVVSVRLPISLIERLDSLCQTLRIERADFFVATLRDYPNTPRPERTRIWLANLAWVLVGGATTILALTHTGSRPIGDRMAPAREWAGAPLELESNLPNEAGRTVNAPTLPLQDPRLDKAWRWGDLQAYIPRGKLPARTQGPAERGQSSTREPSPQPKRTP